jgi:hypothetical protein
MTFALICLTGTPELPVVVAIAIATRASDGLCRPDDRMTRRSRASSDLSDTSYRRAHKPITSVSIFTYSSISQ